MPCNYYTPDEERRMAVAELHKIEAMLCAVLTAAKKIGLDHDQQLINRISERESGISKKELSSWWASHQEKDRARRRAEQAAEQKRQVKAAALAKLTLAERKALGL